jgi:hypothetical protein
MCTDYKLFEGIAHHILLNALNYSLEKHTITIDLTFKPLVEFNGGRLTVVITNVGKEFKCKKWEQK